MTQVRRLVREEKDALSREGLPFDENIPLGAMIEVPAAAIAAAMFTPYVDFLSIGTNDLIQYTLAIDRIDDEVGYLYDPLHPAVLKLVHEVISAGARSKVPVGMCGEMAGDPRFTRLLLGLGLREFSMHPSVLPEIKFIVRDSDIRHLRDLSQRILHCTSPDELAGLMVRIEH